MTADKLIVLLYRLYRFSVSFRVSSYWYPRKLLANPNKMCVYTFVTTHAETLLSSRKTLTSVVLHHRTSYRHQHPVVFYNNKHSINWNQENMNLIKLSASFFLYFRYILFGWNVNTTVSMFGSVSLYPDCTLWACVYVYILVWWAHFITSILKFVQLVVITRTKHM